MSAGYQPKHKNMNTPPFGGSNVVKVNRFDSAFVIAFPDEFIVSRDNTIAFSEESLEYLLKFMIDKRYITKEFLEELVLYYDENSG